MPDLERVLQNTPLTLSQQWYEDGLAVDPGTVTVGITRADGSVLVAAGTATSGATTSPRTYNLTTTHTALLDSLRVTWTSTLKGTLVSYVEVAGGFLFSIAEARTFKPLDSVTTYPTASIAQMRTTVEEAIEEEYGTALVPRYRRQTVTADGAMISLRHPVRSIRAVTVNGTALTAGQLAVLYMDSGYVTGYAWPCGAGNIIVDYEYGLDAPRERIRRDALTLLKTWMVAGPVDDRTATFSSADGGTYGLVVPGRNGSIFGLPSLDAAINASPYRIGVA